MRTIIRNRAAGMALVFSTGSCSGWCFIWICHRITGCGGRFYYCSGSEAFNPFIYGIGYCHFFMCYFTDRRDCCSGGQAEWYARVRYNCRGIPRRCMYRFTGRPVGGATITRQQRITYIRRSSGDCCIEYVDINNEVTAQPELCNIITGTALQGNLNFRPNK